MLVCVRTCSDAYREGGWDQEGASCCPPFPLLISFPVLEEAVLPLPSSGGILVFQLSSFSASMCFSWAMVSAPCHSLIIHVCGSAETPVLTVNPQFWSLLLFLRWSANTCRVPQTALILEALCAQPRAFRYVCLLTASTCQPPAWTSFPEVQALISNFHLTYPLGCPN